MAVHVFLDPIECDDDDLDLIEERRPIPPGIEWLTREEAADLLGMTEDAVRGLERHGHLQLGVHYFKPTPRILRYRRSALERWLTSPARPEPEQQQVEVTEEELVAQLRERAKQLAGGRR